jgi:ATP-dependent protease ClpP protease subunit
MNKIMQLYRDNAERPKQFTNLVNVAGDTATIYLYDMISADWGVSALSVIEAIAQAGDAKILNVHINSPGGDVFEGRAIMAALSAFKGKTVARIDSLCASAATSIALACDEVVMADGAFFMIHNASGMAWGDKQTLRDTADVLEKVEGAIVRDYVQKTGKEESEIRALMDAETWFTANEAMEHGFVDALDKGKKVTNTWNLSAFAKAPKVEIAPEPRPEVTDTSTHEPAQTGFLMSSANANRLRILTIA